MYRRVSSAADQEAGLQGRGDPGRASDGRRAGAGQAPVALVARREEGLAVHPAGGGEAGIELPQLRQQAPP